MEDVFPAQNTATNKNGLYSHKEQRGMLKVSYMWKHRPTGKVGETVMWVSSVSTLMYLCRVWSEAQPNNWTYLPMNFR
jgi:hypothetical protein